MPTKLVSCLFCTPYYGEIVIPSMVENELRAAPELHAGFDWSLIRIASPIAKEQVEDLMGELDRDL